MTRDKLVSFRLTDDEYEHLVQLGDVHAVDRSTLLRQLVASAPLVSIRMTVTDGPIPAGYTHTSEPRPTAGEDEWARWLNRRIYGEPG